MENRESIIIVYLMFALIGFAWGYGLKAVLTPNCEEVIRKNECYKYGGNGCE